MLGDQIVDEPRKSVELAMRGAALENNRLAVDIAALSKVAHHPGSQNPGIGRVYADQPDAVDFAGLGESAGLKQRHCRGSENDRPALNLVRRPRNFHTLSRAHYARAQKWGSWNVDVIS
jgi:hypothetical protein